MLSNTPVNFQIFFETIPGCFLILDPAFKIVAVTDAYLKATKTIRENILNRGLFEVFPNNPDDLTATGVSNLRYSLEQVLEKGVAHTMAVQKYDIPLPASEGGGFEKRYWSPINSPIFNSEGRIIYIIHRVEDVTQFTEIMESRDQQQENIRKMTTEILHRTQELQAFNDCVNSIINSTEDLISALDNQYCFTIFNAAYQSFFKKQFNINIKIGMNLLDTLANFPEEQIRARKNWANALAGNEYALTEEFHDEHGNIHYFEIKYNIIYDKDWRAIGACQVARDVTEHKRFEKTLQEKNLELERANLAKDTFLANMSHELRTPLNAIIGFTGTLLMKLPGPLNTDQEKQLSTINNSGKHLLSLINDLLDLAKIKSGKLEIKPELFSCQNVMEEVAATLRLQAEKKGLQFILEIPSEPIVINSDRRTLSQIIINLVNNAIKFTEKGSVSVILLEHRINDTDHIAINVIDTGIGIKLEDQEKLFNAFQQLHNLQSTEGTGLGLNLSQKLATLLGGNIEYESELNKGSRFTLVLPK